MLDKLGVTGNHLEYMYPLVPEGLALPSAFVDAALLEQVEAAAADALADESWADVLPLLPPALSAEDAVALLAECDSVEQLGQWAQASLCFHQFGSLPAFSMQSRIWL